MEHKFWVNIVQDKLEDVRLSITFLNDYLLNWFYNGELF